MHSHFQTHTQITFQRKTQLGHAVFESSKSVFPSVLQASASVFGCQWKMMWLFHRVIEFISLEWQHLCFYLCKDMLELHRCSSLRTANACKNVFHGLIWKVLVCNSVQMARPNHTNQLFHRKSPQHEYENVLCYTQRWLLMVTSQAVGEHNRASLTVKPEVIPNSSPEGSEWTWRQSGLAGHQQKG